MHYHMRRQQAQQHLDRDEATQQRGCNQGLANKWFQHGLFNASSELFYLRENWSMTNWEILNARLLSLGASPSRRGFQGGLRRQGCHVSTNDSSCVRDVHKASH